MSEPTRNMLGFILVATLAGCAIIVSLALLLNRRPRLSSAIKILAGMAVLGYVIFWTAGLLQLHVAYAFTMPRLQKAKSVTGVPVSTIIKIEGARWTTGDYFAKACGNHDNLICVRLETPNNKTSYYFAYDSRTQVIVPMTDAAATAFPVLLPAGDDFVSICELPETDPGYREPCSSWGMGSQEIKLPAKWFRTAIQAQ